MHDRLKVPLIVTDDDITGTFTFLRALEDHGSGADLSSREVGESWLNYLIKERTVLWWGGLGNSTEHTAWLRLENGVEAPESGSMAQRQGRCRADRRPDLHRRLGDGRSGRSGSSGPARRRRRAGEPRRRSGVRRSRGRRDGVDGVRRKGHRQTDRRRSRLHPAGLSHRHDDR